MLLSLRRSVVRLVQSLHLMPAQNTHMTFCLTPPGIVLPLQQSNGKLSSVANTVWAKTCGGTQEMVPEDKESGNSGAIKNRDALLCL